MFENRDTLLHLLSAPIFAANITSASGSPPTPSQKKEASAFALPQNSRKATQPSPVPSMRETLKEEASSSLPSIAFSRKILMPKSANAQFPRATGNKPMVSIIKFPIDGASKIQCAARKHSLPNNTEPEAKKSAVSTEDFSGRKRLCTQAAGNTLVGIKNEQAIENKVRAPLSVKTKAQRMAKQSAAVYEKECRNADSTAADGLPTPCAHGRTILKPKLAHTQFTTPSSTSQNAEDVTRQIKRKHTGSDEHGRHVKRLAVLHRDATEAFCDVSAKSAAKEGKNELSEKKPIVSHEVSNEVLCDLAGTQRWKHHSTRPLSHHQATSRLARIAERMKRRTSASVFVTQESSRAIPLTPLQQYEATREFRERFSIAKQKRIILLKARERRLRNREMHHLRKKMFVSRMTWLAAEFYDPVKMRIVTQEDYQFWYKWMVEATKAAKYKPRASSKLRLVRSVDELEE